MICGLICNVRCSFYEEAKRASLFSSFNGLLGADFQAEGTHSCSPPTTRPKSRGEPPSIPPQGTRTAKTSSGAFPQPSAIPGHGAASAPCKSCLLLAKPHRLSSSFLGFSFSYQAPSLSPIGTRQPGRAVQSPPRRVNGNPASIDKSGINPLFFSSEDQKSSSARAVPIIP